ncbi:MAG: N-acetylmuramoyl-L-alanine amidase [Clostridiales bacterium]|nr:N-acetylmuramoyl-L-alanine amidase [Clostridiales bacterium]
MAEICLDAGHYGKYNRSPAVKSYYESDTMWKLHLLLKKYLEQYGIRVITTRSSQAGDKGLYDRGYASKGCDLFLSLHSNAVGNGVREDIDYVVAYTAVSGKADQIAGLLTKQVARTMGTRQEARIEHRRGTKGDYYGVVRGAAAAGVPGLILEHSFHTNTRSTNWLLEESNLDRLAREEAKVIAAYFGTEDAAGKAEYPFVGKCTGNSVNVRKGPGTGYGVMKSWPQLDKGNLVDVTGKTESWYRVRIAGKYEGYVFGKYIEKV